jgi:stage III sporulation protein AG
VDPKKLIEKFKKLSLNKQLTNIVIVILVGILIIIAASAFKDTTNVNTDSSQKENTVSSDLSDNNDGSNSNIGSYENQQETKLKNILENMQGVGAVQDMIHFDRGKEQVPAYDQSNSSSVTNEDDNSGGKRTTTQNSTGTNMVLTNNGDKTEPFIIDEYQPRISGIIIIAEGADNAQIRLDITTSVSELYNIPMDKVNVLPMKK